LLLVGMMATVACGGGDDTDERSDGANDGATPTAIEVNIQVTGAENIGPMIEELDLRGLPATVWLSAAEMDALCDELADYVSAGHEVAGKYPGQILEDTPKADQRAEIEAILEASEECAGASIRGFRATKFTSNEATHELLDELEIPYMMRSNRQVLLSAYTYRPYRFDGHDFSVVPMPVTVYFGRVCSLCDVSSGGELRPQDLLEHQKAAFEQNLALGEPLILEWHPSLTYPDQPDGWWSNFTDALDYLESKGERVRFVTAEEIAERYPPTGTRPVDVPPWELPPDDGCACD
jgi:hypothetical protein